MRALTARFPPEQWGQLLRLVRCKYTDTASEHAAERVRQQSPVGATDAAAKGDAPARGAAGLGSAMLLLLLLAGALWLPRPYELSASDFALQLAMRAAAPFVPLDAIAHAVHPAPAATARPATEWLRVPAEKAGDEIAVRLLTPANESRESRRLLARLDADGDGGVSREEFVLGSWRGLESKQEAGARRPLLIWFDWAVLGGNASARTEPGLADALADTMDVVVAEVAVGGAFPQPTTRGLAAVRWLHREALASGIGGRVDASRVAIGGAGGGGTVAAALALRPEPWSLSPPSLPAYKSLLLVAPMLRCPGPAGRPGGSMDTARKDGVVVMGPAQSRSAWGRYASALGVEACAARPDCSPAAANAGQLRKLEHLVMCAQRSLA